MNGLRTIAVAAAALLPGIAAGQAAPSVALEGRDGPAVLEALARECFEARLAPSMPAENVLDCAGITEDRVIAGAPEGANRFVTTHRLRFTLVTRGSAGTIGAEAWTEVEELGSVIELPLTGSEYLSRLQRVLTAVVARVSSAAAPPWAGRYESEQAWRLDAHLHAVSHCDASLAGLTAESVAAELRTIGLHPLEDDLRSLCEQLYTHVFEWGLARGNASPRPAEYARYRAALPAEQRLCTGQLAPGATCAP